MKENISKLEVALKQLMSERCINATADCNKPCKNHNCLGNCAYFYLMMNEIEIAFRKNISENKI